MPYLKESERQEIDPYIAPVSVRLSRYSGAGLLNYIITRVVIAWLGAAYDYAPDYERYNAAMGVLESAKQELYRRSIAPYEDDKRAVNGDVY